MAVRYYATGGKRFYVADVVGYSIRTDGFMQPRAPGRTGLKPPTTWMVLDRDNCHGEVAVFPPVHGQASHFRERAARELAKELNRDDVV